MYIFITTAHQVQASWAWLQISRLGSPASWRVSQPNPRGKLNYKQMKYIDGGYTKYWQVIYICDSSSADLAEIYFSLFLFAWGSWMRWRAEKLNCGAFSFFFFFLCAFLMLSSILSRFLFLLLTLLAMPISFRVGTSSSSSSSSCQNNSCFFVLLVSPSKISVYKNFRNSNGR